MPTSEEYRAAMSRTSTAAWKEYGTAIQAPGAQQGYTGESLIDIRNRLRTADPTISAGVTPVAGAAGAAGAPTTDPMAMYRQALEGLSGGGTMLESQLADIETGKKQAIGAGQQSLVSAGLGGTTMMAGVPLQAEKTAGRARLAARGQVEQLRIQTLASYAGLAEQVKQATAGRQAALESLQTQISAQGTAATTAQKAEEKRLKIQIAAQKQAAIIKSMRAFEARSGGVGGGIGPTTAPTPGDRPFAEKEARMAKRTAIITNYGIVPTTGSSSRVGGTTPAYSYGASLSPDVPRKMVSGLGPTTDWGATTQQGGGYAQQFPSIYGQAEEPVPQWM